MRCILGACPQSPSAVTALRGSNKHFSSGLIPKYAREYNASKLCATPKECFRNHCRIRVIASREFPDNARQRRWHLQQADSASFVPKHGAQIRVEKTPMMQHRYQNGSLTKRSNRFSEDVWQFRFYETTPEGCRYRKSTSVGTVAQYPTKSDALRFIEPLRIRLNLYHRFGRPVSVGALMDHYVEHDLREQRHSTQQSNLSTLNRWIRPRWGDSLLEQVKPLAVEQWLRSLALAPKTKVKNSKTSTDRLLIDL